MIWNRDPYAPARKAILRLLESNLNRDDAVLETGADSAHISVILKKHGFAVSGIEIRQSSVERTKEKYPDFTILLGDIFEHCGTYDVIWNSGLIQCFPDDKKEVLFKKFSTLAPKGIFVVPRRDEYHAATGDSGIGVAGCEEFPTGSIARMLAEHYSVVRIGILPRKVIKLNEEFIYYVCNS